MEELSDDVPLPKPALKVGIVYNLKKGIKAETPDAEAEYDNVTTVEAIDAALRSGGLQTVLLEADEELTSRLLREKPDFVFNIAEGFRGRGREAQIPALLNMLGIPFTGSDETTLCVCLDKALTKRLLATYNVRTPRYAVVGGDAPSALRSLTYPVVVKPVAEGSSKGITDICVAASRTELLELGRKEAALYGEPMLAEEYVRGREFTVGILGNGAEAKAFEPMEIIFKKHQRTDYNVYSYNVKQDYTKYVEYRCPPDVSPALDEEMKKTSLKIFSVLGCRDFSRVDFRLGEDGKLYFIEINPLPGLAPGYSDYPMLAEFCGVSYNELVLSVFRAGAKRCGLL